MNMIAYDRDIPGRAAQSFRRLAALIIIIIIARVRTRAPQQVRFQLAVAASCAWDGHCVWIGGVYFQLVVGEACGSWGTSLVVISRRTTTQPHIAPTLGRKASGPPSRSKSLGATSETAQVSVPGVSGFRAEGVCGSGFRLWVQRLGLRYGSGRVDQIRISRFVIWDSSLMLLCLEAMER